MKNKGMLHFFESTFGFLVGYARRQGITLKQMHDMLDYIYNCLDDSSLMDILMGSASILDDLTSELLAKTTKKNPDNPPMLPGEKED